MPQFSDDFAARLVDAVDPGLEFGGVVASGLNSTCVRVRRGTSLRVIKFSVIKPDTTAHRAVAASEYTRSAQMLASEVVETPTPLELGSIEVAGQRFVYAEETYLGLLNVGETFEWEAPALRIALAYRAGRDLRRLHTARTDGLQLMHPGAVLLGQLNKQFDSMPINVLRSTRTSLRHATERLMDSYPEVQTNFRLAFTHGDFHWKNLAIARKPGSHALMPSVRTSKLTIFDFEHSGISDVFRDFVKMLLHDCRVENELFRAKPLNQILATPSDELIAFVQGYEGEGILLGDESGLGQEWQKRCEFAVGLKIVASVLENHRLTLSDPTKVNRAQFYSGLLDEWLETDVGSYTNIDQPVDFENMFNSTVLTRELTELTL